MAVRTTAVSVATTATVLVTGIGNLQDARPWLIHNAGAAVVYIGGSDVTTANGIPVAIGEKVTGFAPANESLYGIVASGTEAVRVLAGRS